jgi:hypothetical protein
MTMHLVGPYMTTTSYKKREVKMTKKKQVQLEADWLQHNKTAKSFGEPKLTFQEYLDLRKGIVPKVKVRPSKMGIYVEKNTPYRRETTHYPSLNSDNGVAVKKEIPQYTGTAMIGIGQLHKSNAIPVFSREDAIDISKMRRG